MTVPNNSLVIDQPDETDPNDEAKNKEKDELEFGETTVENTKEKESDEQDQTSS